LQHGHVNQVVVGKNLASVRSPGDSTYNDYTWNYRQRNLTYADLLWEKNNVHSPRGTQLNDNHILIILSTIIDEKVHF
jgi:hypothetical protein